MYEHYFRLSRKPFNATPDPAFLYTNRCYQEAYATLLFGVQERKGFIALIGEVGTGKTTLLRRLMEGLNPAVKVVFVYNTTLGFDELVEFICGELDIPASGLGRVGRLQALNEFLIAEARRGGTVVLLLDEAQNLSHEALENLRLISNLETSTDKLLQIVLVGQPELEAKLADPTLRQITQRIAIRFRLEPLDDSEVEPYIDYRLRVVGRSRKELFSDRAIRRLIPHVKGIPRLINVICDNALVLAYATDRQRVTGQMIDSVLADLRVRPLARRPAPAWVDPRERGWGRRDSLDAGPRWGTLGALATGALVLAGVAVVGLVWAPDVAGRLPSLGALTERALAWSRELSAPTDVMPSAGASATSSAGVPGVQSEPASPTIAAADGGGEGASPSATPPVELPPSPARQPSPAPTAPVTDPADDRQLGSPAIAPASAHALRIPAGRTISEVVRAHYGRYSSLALDLVHELNPDLPDVDAVAAGQPLRLPPLDLNSLLRRQPDGSYRLIVSAQPTLPAAAKVAQAVRDQGYAVALTSREIPTEQVLYRVEITALKTRAAAIRAWDTAQRLEWFELAPDATDRRTLPAGTGRSRRR